MMAIITDPDQPDRCTQIVRTHATGNILLTVHGVHPSGEPWNRGVVLTDYEIRRIAGWVIDELPVPVEVV